MSGLILLCGLLALIYVLYWMIQNDSAGRIEDQSGLLQMTIPKGTANRDATAPQPVAGRAGLRSGAPRQDTKAPPFRGRSALAGPSPRQAPLSRATPGERGLPSADPSDEEEIIHPLWRGRRPPGPRRR